MKKGLIILVLLLLIIAMAYSAFLYKNKGLLNTKNTEHGNIKNKIPPQVNTKEARLGSMVLNYPQNAEIYVNNKLSVSINLIQKIKMLNFVIDKRYVSDSAPFSVIFLKNENPDKLLIEKWFDQNNPEGDKQSPFSVISKEKLKINNLESLRVVFHVTDDRAGGYYNLNNIYISKGSDIYSTESFKLPQEPDPVLTVEDIKNIKDYEKTVDQIIQSIHFVE